MFVNRDSQGDSDYYELNTENTSAYFLLRPEVYQSFLSRYSLLENDVPDTMKLMQMVGYSLENRPFAGSTMFSLNKVPQPAPVIRKDRQYIVPIEYSHYGREKYAKRFYSLLKTRIMKTLPPGFTLNESTYAAPTYRNPLNFLLLLFLFCFLAAGIFGYRFTVSSFNLLAWCVISLFLFCTLLGFSFDTIMAKAGVCLSLLMIPVLFESTLNQFIGAGILTLWGVSHCLIYAMGESYLFGSALALLGMSLGIYFLLNNLISGRSNRMQQALNFLGFGIISKLLKGIHKIT